MKFNENYGLPVDTTALPASDDLKTDRMSPLPPRTAAKNSCKKYEDLRKNRKVMKFNNTLFLMRKPNIFTCSKFEP